MIPATYWSAALYINVKRYIAYCVESIEICKGFQNCVWGQKSLFAWQVFLPVFFSPKISLKWHQLRILPFFLLFQKYIESMAKLAKPWMTCVLDHITIFGKWIFLLDFFTPKPSFHGSNKLFIENKCHIHDQKM